MTGLGEPVEVWLRGRGRSRFRHDTLVVASRRGEEPPKTTRAGDLRVGDYVGVNYGGAWALASPQLPRLEERALYGYEKYIEVPDTLTAELAFLLGAYMAEGHTTARTWTVVVTNSVEPVLVRVRAAWHDIFGLQARITHQTGKCPGVVVSSKRLVEWMTGMRCGHRASVKAVPDVIFGATEEEVLAFLQGVFLDAYTTWQSAAAKWAICLESRQGIEDIQELLTRLGIVNSQIDKRNHLNGKTYYELYAAGPWGQDLCRLVPFLEPDKQERARGYLDIPFRSRNCDAIPGITGPELYALVPRGRPGRSGKGTGRQALRHLQDPRTRHVTRESVMRARDFGAELPDWLQIVLTSDTRFVPVVAAASSGGWQRPV